MTRVYYPNIETTSENGRYTLKATSPDNGPDGQGFAFQKNFTYQLTDNQTRRILWTRLQKKSEKSPRELYVSADGWSILQLHGYADELIAVSPDGQDTGYVSIEQDYDHQKSPLQCLAPRHWAWRNAHGSPSTIGYMWTICSHFYFTQFEQRLLFVCTPYWGRRLLFDLKSGRLITDTAQKQYAPLRGWLRQQETEWVTQLLAELMLQWEVAQFSPTFLWDRDKTPFSFWLDLQTAILIIGRLKLQDFIPALHKLAQLERHDNSNYSYHSVNGEEIVYQRQRLRIFINYALLWLNEKPLVQPNYYFFTNETADAKRQPLDLPQHIPNREERLNELQPGMTCLAVLQLMGVPDLLEHGWWEYDFYGKDNTSYSVRLNWAKVRRNRVYKEPSKLLEIKKLSWTKERLSSRLTQMMWRQF